jgi:glycosyltransferase involved in cell wall biosynthesis
VTRLLFLLPSVPDPPDAGAKLRNLGLLRLAAATRGVDVIAFGQSEDEDRLAALGERTQVVPLPRARSRLIRAVGSATSEHPDMADRLWSPEFAQTISCFVQREGYAGVQAEGIEMARYLRLVPPDVRIYDAHNPEFLLQRRASESSPGALARVYSRIQWQRLERFERSVVHSSRLTLAVSEHDANQLLALAGQACVAVVPNGLEVAAYAFHPPSADDAPNILFLGKLDYRPNAEALRWLLEHVLPRVFDAVPGARLFAVGANPPRWLVEAGQHDPRIAVTGYVADERPYLDRCAVLVLPLRIAAGSRLKALVAMASGLPIVSTPMGMEGLEAEPGHDFVLADSADEWSDALSGLMLTPERRHQLAERGRQIVERVYDWAAIRPALLAAYARLGA